MGQRWGPHRRHPALRVSSFSADGKSIVYRVWGEKDYGLRILDLEDRSVKVLTTEPDNLPGWSPDGSRIVFTRRQADGNYDVFTIRPDGSDLRRLTNSPAVDGHAVWSTDGKHHMWNSGMHGWRDEAALYDNTFQPYAPIFIMNADGTGKRPLTDSPWDAIAAIHPGAQRSLNDGFRSLLWGRTGMSAKWRRRKRKTRAAAAGGRNFSHRISPYTRFMYGCQEIF